MKYLLVASLLIVSFSVSYFLLVIYPKSQSNQAQTVQINQRAQALAKCSEWARASTFEYIENLVPFQEIPNPNVMIPQRTKICMNQNGYDY